MGFNPLFLVKCFIGMKTIETDLSPSRSKMYPAWTLLAKMFEESAPRNIKTLLWIIEKLEMLVWTSTKRGSIKTWLSCIVTNINLGKDLNFKNVSLGTNFKFFSLMLFGTPVLAVMIWCTGQSYPLATGISVALKGKQLLLDWDLIIYVVTR